MAFEKNNINIFKEKDKYIAVSVQFPECIGIGETEKDAVKELFESVLSFVEKNIKDMTELVKEPKISVIEQKLEEKNIRPEEIFRKDLMKVMHDVDQKFDKNILNEIIKGKSKISKSDNYMLSDNLVLFFDSLRSFSDDMSSFVIDMPISFN